MNPILSWISVPAFESFMPQLRAGMIRAQEFWSARVAKEAGGAAAMGPGWDPLGTLQPVPAAPSGQPCSPQK